MVRKIRSFPKFSGARRVPLLAGFLTTALLVGVVWFLDGAESRRHRQETKAKVLDRLSELRAAVESELNGLINLTRGLKAYVSLRPNLSQQEFEAAARILVPKESAIRSVRLARNNVVSHVYPLNGNENALGGRPLDAPQQRESVLQAIESSRTVLAGPMKLAQGGYSLISYTPVRETLLNKAPETGPYWGLIILVIDRDALLARFRFSELGKGLDVALRGDDAAGSEVFYGNGSVFDRSSLRLDVTLASTSWQIGAIPVEGWPSAAPISRWLRPVGGALALLLGGLVYQIVLVSRENRRLLLAILPPVIAARMRKGETTIAEEHPDVTVLFADVVGFTSLSGTMSSHQLVKLLNEVFSEFDGLALKVGVEKIKTIGDAYMAVSGLPAPRADHAEAMAEMALGMTAALEHINERRGTTLALRIGLHSGQVTAGVIGASKFIYDLWGDTVNVASRMESTGVPHRIQVSRETYVRLRSKYKLESRGAIEVKGKGSMQTYLLIGRN